MTTNRPSPLSRSAGQACLASRNGLVSSTASSWSHLSSSNSSTGATCCSPALATTASRRPKRSSAASTAPRLPARVARSAACGTPGPSASGSRSTARTSKPSSTSRCATARPMPRPAPVTSAARSSLIARTSSTSSSLGWSSNGALSWRELHRDDIAVAHEVVPTLQAQNATLTRPGVAAGLDERLPADDLGADEALLDVGVDLARGVPGREAVAHVPRLRGLVLTRGEEGDLVQQREGAVDDAAQAGLADAHVGAHGARVLVVEL